MAVPALFIDASLQGIHAGLIDLAAPPGARLVARRSHPDNMGAVAAIGTLSQELLADQGLAWPDLQALIVAHGPGSFTGIKVGLAFVHGVKGALATDLPTLGLSTLAAVAAVLTGRTTTPVALFLAATSTHGFAATAGLDGATTRLVDTGASAAELLASLPHQTQVALIGQWPLLTALLTATGRSVMPLSVAEAAELGMRRLADEAADRWPHGFSLDLPTPQYMRLSTAEEKLAEDRRVQQKLTAESRSHGESP